MIRGMEQKMYKEQEKLKSMKTHKEVHEAYVNKMATLPTYNTIFFPVRVSSHRSGIFQNFRGGKSGLPKIEVGLALYWDCPVLN